MKEYNKLYIFDKQDMIYNEMKCICKFVSDDITRYQINTIYIDNENIVSTNGRVLVVLKKHENYNVENGYYKYILQKDNILLFRIENDSIFPDYKKIMNDVDKKYIIIPDVNLLYHYRRKIKKIDFVFKIGKIVGELKLANLNSIYLFDFPYGKYNIHYNKDDKYKMMMFEKIHDYNRSEKKVYFKIYIMPMNDER